MTQKLNASGAGFAPSPKERGKRAFQAGRFAEAVAAWREIAEPDETLKRALAEAHFRQAAALQLNEASLSHLRNAIQLMPADPIYAYWHAVALHKSGDVNLALPEYQRAEALNLALAPGAAQRNPGLTLWLAQHDAGRHPIAWPAPDPQSGDPRNATPRMVYDAVVLLTLNTEDGTKQSLARLSEMSPKPLPRDVGAQRYAYMGVAHARRGQQTQAVENWRLAARALLTHRLVQHNLAAGVLAQVHAALANQDPATAQKLASEATVENATLKAALSGLHYSGALVAASQGKWDEAAQQLKHVSQSLQDAKGTERRPILHNLALLHEMAEDWAAAAETWREVLRALPRVKRTTTQESTGNDVRKWVRRRVIDCYKRANQLSQAIKALRQAVKQTPDDVDVRLDLVRALYANEQEQVAENEAERLLEKDPDHLDTLLQLGEMQLESGKFYMAEKNLEHALGIAPNDRRVQTGLAEVLHQYAHNDQRYGQNAQAIAHFERAMQYAPEDSGLLLCASRAYAHGGQNDKALDLIQRLLVVGKGKPETYQNVAHIWAEEENTAAIDAMLARAEADGAVDASLLCLIGIDILDSVYAKPTQGMFSALFSKYGVPNLLGDSQALQRPTQPTQPAMRDYAHGLLHRALQHPNANLETLKLLFIPLLGICPHEALPYWQWLVERLPNDARTAMLFGCAIAMQKNYKEAEASFDRARVLAKAAKDAMTEDLARELRRQLRAPEFPDLMRRMFDEMGLDDTDLDDFDF